MVPTKKPTTLVVLAHQDDEFFCSHLLKSEAARGQNLLIVYTCHGSVYLKKSEDSNSSQRRINESERALKILGLADSKLLLFGQELNVFDGEVDRNLDLLWSRLKLTLKEEKISRVVAMAWEGGHTDHDASHLLAVAAARALKLKSDEVFEFPSYNCGGYPRPFFRTGEFPPQQQNAAPSEGKLSFFEALRAWRLAFVYRSQWTSFAGLMPGIIWQLLIHRRQLFRRLIKHDYTQPPHSGELFYRRRFRRSFESFRANTSAFITSTIQSAAD